MPVVMLHGSAGTGGGMSTSDTGPSSHLCLALFTFLVNPPFGLVAIGFAISSRHVAPRDWDGARVRGKIAMFISIAGIIIAMIALLVFVLIYFTEDS